MQTQTLAASLMRDIRVYFPEAPFFQREDLLHLPCFAHVATITRYRYVCDAVGELIRTGKLVAKGRSDLCIAAKADRYEDAAEDIVGRYEATIRRLVKAKAREFTVMDVVNSWRTDPHLTENFQADRGPWGLATFGEGGCDRARRLQVQEGGGMNFKDTMQVTAVLIPVGQEIHASPGDKLMVVAGVVVGVYTGAAPAVAEERKLLPAPRKHVVEREFPVSREPKAARPQPAPEAAAAVPPVTRKRRDMKESEKLRLSIFKLIEKQPGITTPEINQRIGYSEKIAGRSDRKSRGCWKPTRLPAKPSARTIVTAGSSS